MVKASLNVRISPPNRVSAAVGSCAGGSAHVTDPDWRPSARLMALAWTPAPIGVLPACPPSCRKTEYGVRCACGFQRLCLISHLRERSSEDARGIEITAPNLTFT